MVDECKVFSSIQEVIEYGSCLCQEIKTLESVMSVEESNPKPPLSEFPAIIISKTNMLIRRKEYLLDIALK